VERALPGHWAGKRLLDLDLDGLCRVVGVTRLGETQVPSGALIGQEGDMVFLSVSGDRIDELDEQLARVPEKGAH